MWSAIGRQEPPDGGRAGRRGPPWLTPPGRALQPPGQTAPIPREVTGLQADHPHPGGAETAAAPHPEDNLRQDPELIPAL